MKRHHSSFRSPIKGNILRQAGQGLREYREDLFDTAALRIVIPFVFGFMWLGLDIAHRHGYSTPLWFFGLFFLVCIVNAVFLFIRTKRMGRALFQGEDGERYVAQVIERDLLPKGYRVFHDLPFKVNGRQFNIDHLLIGPNGVFCIETKTWSKPEKGETVAIFDGQHILINGKERQPNAIDQARALAKEAVKFIHQRTGWQIPVVPFIVVVGWYVRKSCAGFPDVQVVNEQALSSFIQNTPGVLPTETFHRIVDLFSKP